jgi:hypothetical protein
VTDLDRDDMMEAVTEGVRHAFRDALTSGGRFDLPHELVCDAIRKGVAEAIWRVATNATDMPCTDFYEAIKDGAAEGISKVSGE